MARGNGRQPGYRGREFAGEGLAQIAMPMGGIGGGCICLSGQGGLQDFSIRNRPALTALPDGHGTTDAAFAVLRVQGARPTMKVLEGPLPREKVYDQGLQAQGYRKGGHEGLPRMGRCRFRAAYPFGEVTLGDDDVPLDVRVTGWSPFIPLDDRNSSLPCAILEYELRNRSARAVEYEFSYHLSHLACGASGEKATRNSVLPGTGVLFSNVEPDLSEAFGSASLTVVGHRPRIKAMWFRGPWFDAISALWRELGGTFRPNAGSAGRSLGGRNGGSIWMACRLRPGQSVIYPIVITWHFPNVHYSHGTAAPQAPGPAGGCCSSGTRLPGNPPPKWRPYYASQWKDAAEVAAYVRRNYASLRRRTAAFRDALFRSTLPPEAIDAVSSNLAILKSPTILRQDSGNVWAWEGCFASSGCCPGSCTHVWNYAQALPHLFPALERTLREQELIRSMDDRGHVNFRSALPDGPPTHDFHSAADGQLGGIVKLCRDWRISGDRRWMEGLYPQARRSMEFCIRTWDPDRKGAVIEPHHNTYDIEFWGPDGMCGSIYLAALSALREMADELGLRDEAAAYGELARKGAAFMDRHLFNGEYYQQKVMWKGLRDRSFSKALQSAADCDPRRLRVLRAEGPPYQYGSGCLSDGVIGAWLAKICGVDSPQSRGKVRSTLRAIFRHNFRPDLWGHACTQRPGYAVGHEPGLILCTWPRGGRPTLPFVYSDEVWTGFEYQVASHLIEEGMVAEGLAIVRAARSRYEGRTRNPFNEYECGSYYARAMSSYALVGSLAGFRYSAASRELWLAPKIAARPFRCFFSAASGFGVLTLSAARVSIRMIEGELHVRRLHAKPGRESLDLDCDVTARVGRARTISLRR